MQQQYNLCNTEDKDHWVTRKLKRKAFMKKTKGEVERLEDKVEDKRWGKRKGCLFKRWTRRSKEIGTRNKKG